MSEAGSAGNWSLLKRNIESSPEVIVNSIMVRTRADNSARKAVAAKAPRKQLGASGSAGSSSKTPSKKASYSSGGGGNPLRVCDIPSWQKGIGEFYPKLKKDKQAESEVGKSDKINEEVHLTASVSDSQPGSSCNGETGMQMECESSSVQETVADEVQGNSSNEERNGKEANTDDGREGNVADKDEQEKNLCGSDDGSVATSIASNSTIDNPEAGPSH